MKFQGPPRQEPAGRDDTWGQMAHHVVLGECWGPASLRGMGDASDGTQAAHLCPGLRDTRQVDPGHLSIL